MNIQSKRKKWSGCLGLTVISLAMFLIFTQPVYSQTKHEPKKSSAIREALSEIVMADKAPGMIAAIISSESITAIGSAGVRKAGTDAAITDNDFVHLGSCTKAMTSTMLATLVAEGKLNWDMTLIEAIPELKTSIHSDYHTITIWELLTHRAGLPRNAKNWRAYKKKEIKERRLAILKESLKTASAYKRGEFHYSNFGYIIAGCMAEKITGLSWESLMKKRLFDPLGMTSAGYGAPGTPKQTDQPWGHKKSMFNNWRPDQSDYDESLGPAGLVHCTIEDWAKFISLYLAPDKNSILDRKYLNKLVEPVGFYSGGWLVAEHSWAKGKIVTHNGSNERWYTIVLVAPNLDRAFVVATNSRDSDTVKNCTAIINKMVRMELDSNND